MFRGRCPVHAPRPWAGNDERRRELGAPTGSERVRLNARVRRRAGGRCESCGTVLERGAGSVDHRVPLALAPELARDPRNLWLLCERCDAAKTAADLELLRTIDAALARGDASTTSTTSTTSTGPRSRR